MTTKQILLAAAISSLLTACGSSSSQGTVDTSSTSASTDSSSTDSSSIDSSSTDSSSTDSSSTDSSSTDSSSTDSASTDSSSTDSSSTDSSSTDSSSTDSSSTDSSSTDSSSTDSSSTDSSSTDSSSTDSSSTDSVSTDSSSTDSSSTDSSSTDSSSSLSGAPIKLITTSNGAVKSLTNYTATSDLNQLVIDGKTIDLIPVGFSVGGLFTNTGTINGDSTHRVVSGNKYDSKFGVIENGDEIIAFSQGDVTATSDMPVSGTASYAGRYAGYNHDSNQFDNGDFSAVADFALKTVAFTVEESSSGIPGGKINATISGNTFATAASEPVQGNGVFYGDDAAELGGTYTNNGYNGYHYTAAFGATKQ